MAKVNTFALELNLNFLARSRNHCIVCSRTPQNFLAKKGKNHIVNFGEATPLSWTRDSTPISESNLRFLNKVGGLPCVSPSPLPALPDSARHLLRFPLRRSRLLSSWVPLMMSQNDGPNIPQESTKTVKCVIKGRVQGVFYRNWTIENATQLGLKGWVRNRRDGSVEALFSGNPESVEEMQQRCRRGPPDAMVTGFQALPCDEDPGTGFQRKPTV